MNINFLKNIKKIALNRYVNTTFWYATESLFRLVGGLFIGILLARYLGPDSFGHFTYIYTIFILLNVIVKFGLDANIIKELKSKKNTLESIISSAMIIRFFLALSINLIILFLYLTHNIEDKILVISLTLFFIFSEVFEPYYMSKNDGKTLSIIKIITLTLSYIIKLAIIYFDLGLEFLIYNIFLESMILAFLYWISIKKIDFTLNVSVISVMFRQSIPLVISNLLIIAFIKIDQLMVKFLLSNKDLGIYSVGIKITETTFVASTIFSMAIFPYLINISSSKNLLYERCLRFISLFAWLGILISILIFLFSETLISLFGSNYTQSVEILKITCWIIPFVYIGAVFNKLILVKGYGYIILRKSLFALILNVVLNYLLIQKYGINGAAYALIISYFYMHIIHDIFENKIRNIAINKIKCLFDLVKNFKILKNEIINFKQ